MAKMFDWLRSFLKRPVPAAAVAGDEEPDWRTLAAEQARREVRAGYDDPDQIRANVAAAFEDELDSHETDAIAAAAVADERRRLARDSETWPAITDYDRLQAAFGALEASGVIAREIFTCCGTCGHAEIGAEVAAAEAAGATIRGYTFFHMQDTEAAVDGHGLYLAYGDMDGERDQQVEIGREIVSALERSGLEPSWNGSADTRIFVPLDWRRRL